MVRPVALLSAFILAASTALAHDFWLDPSTFRPHPGDLVRVSLRVGQNFIGDPVPRSALLIDKFTVRDASGEQDVIGPENGDPAGYLRPRGNAAMIGYLSKPYPLDLTPQKYHDFLQQEGFTNLVAPDTPHHEQFSRYAKAYIGSGPTTRIVTQPFGWRFELIPETDPLAPGPLRIRAVLDGKPYASALITAMLLDDANTRLALRTDASGHVTLVLPKKGVWLIKCVAIAPGESLWASFTFER